jgi:hypothetical protein
MKAAICAGFGDTFPARLDQHIIHLQNLNYEVLVVLGNCHSEGILRQSRCLEDCELIFDTHSEETTFLTNIHAAAFATEDAFLVCNAHDPLAPADQLQALIDSWYRAGFRTAIQGFGSSPGPLLITRSGNQSLRGMASLKSLQPTDLALSEPLPLD